MFIDGGKLYRYVITSTVDPMGLAGCMLYVFANGCSLCTLLLVSAGKTLAKVGSAQILAGMPINIRLKSFEEWV